jgi:hypothetical protein
MHSLRTVSVAVAASLLAATALLAQNGAADDSAINPHSNNVLMVAVYGDSPYGLSPTDTTQTDKTAAFVDSINADPKVDLVLQVGDIHSGKQFCTESYDRLIYRLWTAFKNPLVYTPGDNEWTDCHKAGEGGHVHDSSGNPVDYADGDPVANLDLVRSIFFANPGWSMGTHPKRVLSQAQNYDPNHRNDRNYVENVMWEQSKVLFVTLNVPGGSNNDADPWFGVKPETIAQTTERLDRTDANLRWLDAAFAQATADRAEAVVIQLQADMWDLDSKPVTHLSNYETFIASIAGHALAFGKPVLLFNGDSHHYRSDNPLQPGQPCVFESGAGTVSCGSIPAAVDYTPDAWTNHPYYNVPNFHRVVVHGSTEPLEWLRLTITPGTNAPASANAFGPFAWERVVPTLP